MPARRPQQSYDHRLRQLAQDTGDVKIATRLGVPRSTAAGWLRQKGRAPVTLAPLDMNERQLQAEVVRLRRRIARLMAVFRLVVALVRACGVDLAKHRVPDGQAKGLLLRAVARRREALPLRIALRLVRLSPSRYHEWRRAQNACELDDRSSCPRLSPHQLTPGEVRTIKEMVTSPEYRHVPTGRLAALAQRLGRVFASSSTWHRLVRLHAWRRPRLRVHPAKPKVGLRASKANEVWHIDTTLTRLLDGTRACLHAVIDNFSRRTLSWRLTDRFDPTSTVAVLLEAGNAVEAAGTPPTVLAAGGVENVNNNVDELIRSGLLRRVLAQTELRVSISMIEAWWRVLKHQWLYLHHLDNLAKVRRLIAFYVDEHNSRLPDSAFRGQTPDELFFGTGAKVPQQLDAARHTARAARLEVNRSASCPACPADTAA